MGVLAAVCSVIGSIGSVLSFILLLVLMLGSINNSTPLKNIWFIQLDVCDIASELIPGLAQLPASESAKLKSVQYVTVGLWNACYWAKDDSVTCSKPSASFYFSIETIIYNFFNFHVKTQEIPGVDMGNVKTYSKVAVILFVVAIIAAFIASLIGIVSVFRHRATKLFAAVFAAISWAAAIVAALFLRSVYAGINSEVANQFTATGLRSKMGVSIFVVALLAAVTSLVGVIAFVLGAWRAKSNKSSSKDPETVFLYGGPLGSSNPYTRPPENREARKSVTESYEESYYLSDNESARLSAYNTQNTYYDPHRPVHH